MTTCTICGQPLHTYQDGTLHVLSQAVECDVPDPPVAPEGAFE